MVRVRALETIAEKKPALIVERAGRLLATEHDQTRSVVCDVLAGRGDETASDALEALLRDPGASKNPNVMRIRAVTALARCGDADSLSVIEPHATSGAFFNGLTGRAIDTIVAIVERHPKSRKAARAILKRAFPPPPPSDGAERERRACTALARRVHAALGRLSRRKVPFPDVYDEATRAKLIASW